MKTELDFYRAFVAGIRADIEDCQDAGQFIKDLDSNLKEFFINLNSFREDPVSFCKEESKKNLIKRYAFQQKEEEKYKRIGFEKRDIIIKHLFESDGVIDEGNVSFYPKRYPFSSQEFMGLYNYLSEQCEADEKNISFPEARRYFVYKGKCFIWRMLVGQGTACQLCLECKTWPQDWPMEFITYKAHTLC